MLIYGGVGVALFSFGIFHLTNPSMLKKILALNIMSSGVFLVLIAIANRNPSPDPIPHAMVLTGIVVAVSITAFAIKLAKLIKENSHE